MDGKKYWPALRPFTLKPFEKQPVEIIGPHWNAHSVIEGYLI